MIITKETTRKTKSMNPCLVPRNNTQFLNARWEERGISDIRKTVEEKKTPISKGTIIFETEKVLSGLCARMYSFFDKIKLPS